ncbi:MAG: hypothetical protein HC846_13730, partial [Blastocatellia bacterium]|nr:hypothetical protein [Blastocatellia bacterium]
MNEFLQNLWQMQKPLMATGLGFLAVTGILAILWQFDSTQILGVNRWIKPIKFSVSAAIFLFTVAVYLFYLPRFDFIKISVRWMTIIAMTGEVFLITMQAAHNTTSHFNVANPFDSAVFSAMALMIFVNTLVIVALTFLYFQADINLPPAIIWGFRLGAIVFILGSIEGGFMASHGSHTVGAADGAKGLPFVNWSVSEGDLRCRTILSDFTLYRQFRLPH